MRQGDPGKVRPVCVPPCPLQMGPYFSCSAPLPLFPPSCFVVLHRVLLLHRPSASAPRRVTVPDHDTLGRDLPGACSEHGPGGPEGTRMSFSGERWKAGRSGARRISGTDCGTVGYMLHVLLGDLCTMDAASDGVRLWPTSPPPPSTTSPLPCCWI